jgi:hypothetical protein
MTCPPLVRTDGCRISLLIVSGAPSAMILPVSGSEIILRDDKSHNVKRFRQSLWVTIGLTIQ